MRLLIICHECHRQYDASGLQPGRRVRCHCGEVIVVEEPRGHEANVVRCSSCGAPREAGSTFCVHCRSDFTLHELDMQTVCPSCLTRVSDRAKYCHSCGGKLSAEMVAGEIKPLPCPACAEGPHMRSRRLGHQKISAMECDQCAGLWLGNQTFAELTTQAAITAMPLDLHESVPRPDLPGMHKETRGSWSYRKCPECGKLMTRRQHAKGSGVILDTCKDHGTWFDAQELPAILAWIRAGGKSNSRNRANRGASTTTKVVVRRSGSLGEESTEKWTSFGSSASTLADIFSQLFEF